MKKLLKLAQRIIASNFADLKFPYRMTYIVTYKCQFKCGMCNIWQKPKQDEFSLTQISEFFKKSNQFSWINLSGGEVFLREDFLDIVEIILKNCSYLYLLDLPTNGFCSGHILKSVRKILSLYNIPKFIITVSLDGPPKVHNEIRNVPGAWDKAVETFNCLRDLRSSHFDVFFGMTLQPLNMGRFYETFESASVKIKKLKYTDFHINLLQHSQHYYGNREEAVLNNGETLCQELNSIARVCRRPLLSAVSFLERKYQSLAKTYLNENKMPVCCQAFSASLFMDPLGNVYPCSIYDKPIGNAADFDYDIYKLWDTPFRRAVREDICRGNCPKCWTPCEAYQSILANLVPKIFKRV